MNGQRCLVAVSLLLTASTCFGASILPKVAGTYKKIKSPAAWTQFGVSRINDNGDIFGSYSDKRGRRHAFQSKHGQYLTLSFPHLDTPVPPGLNTNASGDIIGTYDVKTGHRGFLVRNGKFIEIDYPGARSTSCFDINDRGAIIGLYERAGIDHGFLWERGVFKTIAAPQVKSGWLIAIYFNNRGQIVESEDDDVGTSKPTPETDSFLIDHGVATRIAPPYPNGSVIVCGIDDAGDIIGQYYHAPNPKDEYPAFLLRKKRYYRFDFPRSKAQSTFGASINNKGQIVGSYQDRKGRDRSFVLTLR